MRKFLMMLAMLIGMSVCNAQIDSIDSDILKVTEFGYHNHYSKTFKIDYISIDVDGDGKFESTDDVNFTPTKDNIYFHMKFYYYTEGVFRLALGDNYDHPYTSASLTKNEFENGSIAYVGMQYGEPLFTIYHFFVKETKRHINVLLIYNLALLK